MGHFDAGIGVIELFYPDLGEAKVFDQDVLGPPADSQDDTSASFVLGEQAVILLGLAAAQELVEPVAVAGPGSGVRTCYTIAVPEVRRPGRPRIRDRARAPRGVARQSANWAERRERPLSARNRNNCRIWAVVKCTNR